MLGPVYRAIEPSTDRQVGIKLFRLDATPEQAAVLAGRLSALVSSLPSCPSIAAPLGAGLEGLSAYLAQEYVAADSIEARLRRRMPTSLDSALPLLEQVAEALEEAAAAGVYHGALHPRDVLVSTRGAVTVTGLGVVQALEAAGLEPPFRRPYAAPERLGDRAWDARADVFSLAVLALELATGRRPLLPETGPAWQGVGLDPARAAAVREVFARGLAPDPEERASSAARWVASLELALRLGKEAGTAPQRSAAPPVGGLASLQEGEAVDAGGGPAPGPASPGGRDAAPADEGSGRAEADVWAEVAKVDREWSTRDASGGLQTADLPLADATPDFTAVADAETGTLANDLAGNDVPRLDAVTAIPAADAADALTGPTPLEEPTNAPMAPAEAPPAGAQGRAGATPRASDATMRVAHDPGPLGPAVPGAALRDRDGAGGGTERLEYTRSLAVPGAERSTVAWWVPAAVSLVVGVLAGFVAGYAVGVKGRVPAVESSRTGRASADASSPEALGALATEERVTPTPEAGRAEAAPPAVPAPDAGPPASAARPRDRARPAVGSLPRGGPPVGAVRFDGRLLVRAAPAGAAVEVNGAAVGVAPLALADLAPGTYRVRVSAPGYEAAERRVELTRQRPRAALAVTLPPVGSVAAGEVPALSGSRAALASIDVVSRPARARVFLDGRAVGMTPLRVSALEPRTYTVRLELTGHRPWTLDVRAVAGRLVRVTASLEPETLP